MSDGAHVQHDRPPGARPYRMKGFWRAVRRQERWAVEIDKKEGFSRLLALTYMHFDWAAEWKRSDYFLRQLSKDDIWFGGTMIVPFTYCREPSFQATLKLDTRRTKRNNKGPRKKRP